MSIPDFDFSQGLYDSSGSTVAGPAAQKIATADTNYFDKLLNLVGVGVSAYSTVQASKQATAANNRDPAPAKTAAPVIGLTAQGGLTTNAKLIIGGIAAVVILAFGFLLLRKK